MSAWFEKRRSEYDQEGSGSRLKTLEAIPDHKTSELVQEEDSLQQHLEMRKQQQGDSYNVEVEAINFFCAKAHWMRGSFEARLSGICDALNKIRSHTELGKLGLDLDPAPCLDRTSLIQVVKKGCVRTYRIAHIESYIYIYIYLYVCMYVCMYVNVHTCTY